MENNNGFGAGVKQSHKAGWIIFFTVLIILVLAAGGLFAYMKFGPASKVQTTEDATRYASTIKDLSVTNSSDFLYYTMSDYNKEENYTYKIFKASLDLSVPDIQTHSFIFQGRSAFFPNTEGNVKLLFVIRNSEATIYSLDIAMPGTQPMALLTIPLNASKLEGISSIAFADNGNSLAYIKNENHDENASNSVLHIVDIKTKQEKETYPISERSALYSGVRIMKVAADNRFIYLDETGGDAGAVWTTWFKVDRNTKKVVKLTDLPLTQVTTSNPAYSAFSPDGSKVVFAHYSINPPVNELTRAYGDVDEKYPCFKWEGGSADIIKKYASEGGVLSLKDLNNNQPPVEIYRNLDKYYDNNFCILTARRITSVQWLDNDRILFGTIDGYYEYTVSTKKVVALYEGRDGAADPARNSSPIPLLVKTPYILDSRFFIIDQKTGKQLKLNAPGNASWIRN